MNDNCINRRFLYPQISIRIEREVEHIFVDLHIIHSFKKEPVRIPMKRLKRHI